MTSTPPPSPGPTQTAGGRRRPGWLVPLVAISAAVLAACCVGSVAIVATSGDDAGSEQPAAGGTGGTPGAAPTQDTTDDNGGAEEPDSPAPAPEPEGFGAGIWEVGAEIPPGTYVTTGPNGGALAACYWARLAGFTGDFDEIIANDNLNPDARGRVTIAESDTGVEFTGDCRWVAVADADPVQVGAEVSEGTWAVGEEIQPGTYTTNAADGDALDTCYWARLSGFTGDFDQIIANGNIEAGARGRIQISPSDAGVQFTGDCTWTRS